MSEYTFDAENGVVFGRRGKPIRSKDSKGYVFVKHHGKYIGQAHRMLWEHVHGPVPEGMQIDHINGDKADNRIANLRLCTNQQNQQNRKVIQGATASKGVTVHQSGKFQAQIKHRGRCIYLGLFETEQEAAAAYQASATEKFGEFASLGRAA